MGNGDWSVSVVVQRLDTVDSGMLCMIGVGSRDYALRSRVRSNTECSREYKIQNREDRWIPILEHDIKPGSDAILN